MPPKSGDGPPDNLYGVIPAYLFLDLFSLLRVTPRYLHKFSEKERGLALGHYRVC